MQKMRKFDVVLGFKLKGFVALKARETCIIGKIHMSPFSILLEGRDVGILKILHFDVSGHMLENSFGGERCVESFIHNLSRKVILFS